MINGFRSLHRDLLLAVDQSLFDGIAGSTDSEQPQDERQLKQERPANGSAGQSRRARDAGRRGLGRISGMAGLTTKLPLGQR